MLVAKSYADHRHLRLSTVGRIGMGSGRFFHRLAEGRVTFRRAECALDWFYDNWPEDLEWPSDIPRPSPYPASDEAA